MLPHFGLLLLFGLLLSSCDLSPDQSFDIRYFLSVLLLLLSELLCYGFLLSLDLGLDLLPCPLGVRHGGLGLFQSLYEVLIWEGELSIWVVLLVMPLELVKAVELLAADLAFVLQSGLDHGRVVSEEDFVIEEPVTTSREFNFLCLELEMLIL